MSVIAEIIDITWTNVGLILLSTNAKDGVQEVCKGQSLQRSCFLECKQNYWGMQKVLAQMSVIL